MDSLKRPRRTSIGPLPTGRAIDVLVTSLLQLDKELSAIDMDHAVRTQYRYVVNKWLETNEGNVVQLLVERVAQQDEKGEKSRRVLNEIIHKIPSLNATDRHHHHGHEVTTLPEVEEDHVGLVKQNTVEHLEELELEKKLLAQKNQDEGEKDDNDGGKQQEAKEQQTPLQTDLNSATAATATSTTTTVPEQKTNGVENSEQDTKEQDTKQEESTTNLEPTRMSGMIRQYEREIIPSEEFEKVAPDWENTDYAGDAIKRVHNSKSLAHASVAVNEAIVHFRDEEMNDSASASATASFRQRTSSNLPEQDDDIRPDTQDTAIAALTELDPRLNDDVYDDEIELFLLSHLSVEQRQLRPVTIALCCSVLFKTWSKTPRFFHLNRTCNALMRVIYTHPDQHLSIYTTEDPKEYLSGIEAASHADTIDGGGTWNAHGKTCPNHDFDVPSLADLLSNVPYSSIVRDLEPQVEALVKQRQLMSAAQTNALARRESRKRAILRTAAKWQQNMLHQNFVQWHNMTRTLKEQRTKLVSHFLTMHTPKIKDIFDAWHIISINNKLEACEEERDRTKNMMNTLREQLAESAQTEQDLASNLQEQIERRDMLAKKLKETLAAIEAQRIPGTKEVMFTVAQAFLRYARIVMREPKRLLDWAVTAPSVEKIARMYWVDREERRMKEREKDAAEKQGEEAERQALEKAKSDDKKKKREERDRQNTEKRRAAAAALASQTAEDAFNARFEEAKAAYEAEVSAAKKDAAERGEDESSIAVPPFSPSELGLTLEIRQKEVAKAASEASKKVLKEEQSRLMKLEFAKAEKAGEEATKTAELIAIREKKFKEQQERRDNRISGTDVKEALRGMLSGKYWVIGLWNFVLMNE
jgi:hypothetical protein